MENKTSKYINKQQKEFLVDFIKCNEKLNSGKFDNTFTRAIARNLWESATIELNKLGVVKTWDQWRQVSNKMKFIIQF